MIQQKYLGVELTRDFSWSKHISQVTSGENKNLGLLKTNLRCCDEKTKATAYKTLVRPKLEYCSSIWDPHKQNLIEAVEKVQHRAARFVANDYRRESSVTQLLQQLEWERLDASRLTVIFKELNHLAPSNKDYLKVTREEIPHNRPSRNYHKTTLKESQLTKTATSFSLYP